MKKLFAIAVVLAAAAIFPTGALAAFSGVVVGKAPGSLAVASKGGLVHTVATRTHARIGARVRVNGSAVRVLGRAHRVRVHAVVVRRAGSTLFLAGGRSLFVVHAFGRRLASVVAQPLTGSVVNTTATITATGQLDAGPTQVVGRQDVVEVQAPVVAVAPGSITVNVNGQPLTIRLPAGIQLPASLVGQFVTLNLRLAGEPVAQEDDEANDNDDNDADDNDNDDDGDHGEHHGDDDHGGHGHG